MIRTNTDTNTKCKKVKHRIVRFKNSIERLLWRVILNDTQNLPLTMISKDGWQEPLRITLTALSNKKASPYFGRGFLGVVSTESLLFFKKEYNGFFPGKISTRISPINDLFWGKS